MVVNIATICLYHLLLDTEEDAEHQAQDWCLWDLLTDKVTIPSNPIFAGVNLLESNLSCSVINVVFRSLSCSLKAVLKAT